MTAYNVKRDLKTYAHPDKAKVLSKFFKTGLGQYGAGDKFLGVKVPEQRLVVKKYGTLPLEQIEILLDSAWHEERLTGALILVYQFSKNKANPQRQKEIFDFYLGHRQSINNWDLVDLTAPNIVGEWLITHPDEGLLDSLKNSKIIWERRIAIVSSFAFLKHGDDTITYNLAGGLMTDEQDLIHKAVGWMLREAGKRVSQDRLLVFLDQHYKVMPRTMLRYAIERLTPEQRAAYLKK